MLPRRGDSSPFCCDNRPVPAISRDAGRSGQRKGVYLRESKVCIGSRGELSSAPAHGISLLPTAQVLAAAWVALAVAQVAPLP